MSRRSIGCRLERLQGRVGGLETGGRMGNVEFYREAPDGTLIHLPEYEDGKDHVEGLRTIQVVFGHPKHEGGRGPGA